ncbi:unnamed protein product [Pelagomonas calceolata]|uniref:Uncharacterized protein n=1 Tax=Pelagomonas calceolata TaxID=35677 RepID=A0A7S3ZXH4_9STRA|nr:unnamed protein product [Pelagomonas calceolata]
MHKALKLKRVADALAAAGGGWLPLTLKAWRKYVRRKRGKENKPPALPPPPPVAEPPVLDTCAKLQPPSPPLCQTYAAPPVPPPRRRPLRGALREEAVQLAALLERRRAASATYLLEQHQSKATRRRLTARPKPIQSKRFGWLKMQGARSPADKTAQQALKIFPALRCLEVASGARAASVIRRRGGGAYVSPTRTPSPRPRLRSTRRRRGEDTTSKASTWRDDHLTQASPRTSSTASRQQY